MARNKKGAQTDAAPAAASASATRPADKQKPAATPPAPSTSALIICRNKHWRYISSFHGPWLQLPPEVLESLAHSNYLAPRPHPIHPAVFFDLVKIRKAVDEATNLAVRAASGLTSAALSTSLHAGNSMLGSAAALGIAYGGGGGGKLSRERKHRMRELATSKLSQAYHLDEIAASVATMQSASTLEDVAHLVLQRSPAHVDAKYVHFFHEKIPSRMMAQCTPLHTLDDIISERPHDPSPLRTRALTRIFKDDYANAARDLSEALATARYLMAQHRAGRDQLVLAKTFQDQHARDWRHEAKIPDEDQPTSLETQLLFHRAGVYFTLACSHVHAALDGQSEAHATKQAGNAEMPDLADVDRRRAEARKLVRQNAKRALRDYVAFLSHFDYTPGISAELAEALLQRFGNTTNGHAFTKDNAKPNLNRLLESSASSASSTSEALVPHKRSHGHGSDRASWPKLPPPDIFKVSQLFESAPPASLPPYPPIRPATSAESAASAAAAAFADSHESITYHPLLTDALHSLLLCHALLQTPPKEHLRHAHNAARLARVCDGYPIFLAARSPARADWIEVLRRAGNWIGIGMSWETLCRPAPLPGHNKMGSGNELSKTGSGSAGGVHSGISTNTAPAETETQERERQKHEAILEALADERVVDEESFQRAVRARERRFREDEEAEKHASLPTATAQLPASNSSASSSASSTNGTSSLPKTPTSPAAPKRWAQDDGREYPISTERAEAISRWVREAPNLVESSGTKKRRTKAKGKKPGLQRAGSTGLSLAESVETLSVAEEEEEIDE